MPNKRSRGWCFTLNNPEEGCLSTLEKHAQYLIAGSETAPTTGTKHLQGYCYFKNDHSLKQLQDFLPGAHLEIQKGNFEQAIEYCKKDGDYHEVGVAPVSRKRKGELGAEFWADIKLKTKEGRIDEVPDKVFCTHYSTLKKIAADYAPMPPDADDTTGEWYWGPTGTGKSLKARSENPGFFLKPCNKWWCGYRNEDVVLIEDIDKNHHVLGHHLKIWADRYSFPAEVKGSKINIRPKKIIVTSNYHPADIWSGEPNTLEPIQRRFKIQYIGPADSVAGLSPNLGLDTQSDLYINQSTAILTDVDSETLINV